MSLYDGRKGKGGGGGGGGGEKPLNVKTGVALIPLKR